ncbi:BMP family ABC transporter substrate-binding protein [Acidisoma cladoniae]|jgi:basic membrane protein A|uniref:BMP family ABC transporter substrate-binding protein n=1 Tax=Acidisoma cladoniae TaxID=3040935 RepID=UPI00254C00DD|nr:BMP family ABC transporter substrate-binding protein [Acidisoma sp. PAMC 29798]
MTASRRTVMLGALGGGAALSLGLGGRRAFAADPLGIGFIYVGPISNAGWTYQHNLGRLAVEKEFGDKVKTAYVESVPEGADSQRVISQLSQTNKLLFTTSFGYMEPTIKAAKQFPGVKYEHCTGFKTAKNVGIYNARFYEGRYLSGMIAGAMSKSGVLGHVVPFPIPEVAQGINALILGAQAVNPNIKVKLVWTSSWFDPGKEKEATDTLIGQGCDVISDHCDSTATNQAADEKGVWNIGYNSDMAPFAPKTCLTSVTNDWSDYYISRVKAVMDGTWTSDNVWGGIQAGMVKMTPYNKAIPDHVVQMVEAKKAAIASGVFSPFQGPIKDQSGAVKVASGAKLSDDDILSMDWLVQGVEGKLG